MGRSDSVRLYRLKRMLNELSQKKGRGTELISLYIPQGKPIHEVIATLREEYGTASNIKSDSTRNHVLDALTKTMQRLKLYNRTPENGLVIFCGALPTNGLGSEVVRIFEIEPPKPLNIFLYRCDDHFHTDILKDMLKEEKVIGIIAIDSSEAGIGILEGNKVEVVDHMTSGVGGKHRAGGQSARRYERLREMELNDYFNRVAEHAKSLLIDTYGVVGVIVAGPGPTKDEFLKNGYLDYRLQKNVLAVLDISYAGREGVREALEKAQDILKEYRLMEEKRLVRRLFEEINSSKGLALYGMQEVLTALKGGIADVVLVNDNIARVRVEAVCRRCGAREERIVSMDKAIQVKQEMISKACTRCSSMDYDVYEQDIIEYLDELAMNTGTRVEVISSGTEDGKMLESLGQIAAILRYRIN
ncbi:MAG: peptide chain release factor aRF-1 [Candidatus Nitrosocaldus sp.]|nr:peptide chain release factor aRF-1 [Candidatus Nitrosocaldus sp.]MDW8275974.1 peptide chain release factor aRF-1 [Candidatus Nitrosocaldus sp.]